MFVLSVGEKAKHINIVVCQFFCWCHFEERKMATKRVPRARIRVSTPKLAIIFRGETVSGNPGARRGPKIPQKRPEYFFSKKHFTKKVYVYVVCVSAILGAKSGPGGAARSDQPRPSTLSEHRTCSSILIRLQYLCVAGQAESSDERRKNPDKDTLRFV